jgi:hypothetical protein
VAPEYCQKSIPTCLETSSKGNALPEEDVLQPDKQTNNKAGKGSTKTPRVTVYTPVDTPLHGHDIVSNTL